ncbi:hypothetical protein AGMMS49546_35940 [Spirochaetia bacterium]|nr:hypothetical protein AGMMS49546_35940 [Spirochaetia bacterium]
MTVKGCDCSIVIKTAYREFGVPYAEETIREAVSLLQEQASIEGNGSCKAIRKSVGVTGCVVTPLTIGTAPLLLYLAMGSAGLPLFVSETRNVYQYRLDLVPMEGGACFDLVQDRGGERLRTLRGFWKMELFSIRKSLTQMWSRIPYFGIAKMPL